MNITLILHPNLQDYLPDDFNEPDNFNENELKITIKNGISLQTMLDDYQFPEEILQLVALNGNFIPMGERANTLLTEGDKIMLWPPLAGG